MLFFNDYIPSGWSLFLGPTETHSSLRWRHFSGNKLCNVVLSDSDWPFGNVYCTISNFMANITISASVFTLMAISFDRWVFYHNIILQEGYGIIQEFNFYIFWQVSSIGELWYWNTGILDSPLIYPFGIYIATLNFVFLVLSTAMFDKASKIRLIRLQLHFWHMIITFVLAV